jgi:hypothetical protein
MLGAAAGNRIQPTAIMTWGSLRMMTAPDPTARSERFPPVREQTFTWFGTEVMCHSRHQGQISLATEVYAG